MGREKLEVVTSFWYLVDCLFSGGGYEFATIIRCHIVCGKFSELLPVLTSRQFPSLRDVEFTIRVSGVPCSMQAKPGFHPYLICIVCNAIIELGFVGCKVSPPRTKSARRISWRGRSLTTWQRYSALATQMAQPCSSWRWLAEESTETQSHRTLWLWPS